MRTSDGRRSSVLEGATTVLGGSAAAFKDVPIAPAPPASIAAFAAERFDADGLDVGELVGVGAPAALDG